MIRKEIRTKYRTQDVRRKQDKSKKNAISKMSTYVGIDHAEVRRYMISEKLEVRTLRSKK